MRDTRATRAISWLRKQRTPSHRLRARPPPKLTQTLFVLRLARRSISHAALVHGPRCRLADQALCEMGSGDADARDARIRTTRDRVPTPFAGTSAARGLRRRALLLLLLTLSSLECGAAFSFTLALTLALPAAPSLHRHRHLRRRRLRPRCRPRPCRPRPLGSDRASCRLLCERVVSIDRHGSDRCKNAYNGG